MADPQKHFMNPAHGRHMQSGVKPALPQADGDPNQGADDQPEDGIPCPHCGAILTIKPRGELAEVNPDDDAPTAGGDSGSYGL